MSKESKTPCCKRNIWIDIVLITIPSIVMIVVTFWIFQSTNNSRLFYLLEPQIDKYLSYTEYNHLMKLMDKGVVISADDIISNLVSYYNVLITILLSTIAIIIFIIIQTNKRRNEEIISDMVKQEVENRHKIYTESSLYRDSISSIIEKSAGQDLTYVFLEKKEFLEYKDFYQVQLRDLKQQIEELKGQTHGDH